MASPPSHCRADEVVVWSCSTKQKVYSVCSSAAPSATSGYLQYRAGAPRKPGFFFPARAEPPAGRFTATMLARGVRFAFSNEGYLDEVFDPLVGEASIVVSRERQPIATIGCAESTHTLTENSTLALLRGAGIAE